MRALPIIVDLFILMAIFAVVLFYASFGGSAPSRASTQMMLFEFSAQLSGPSQTLPATQFIAFRLELIDSAGVPVRGRSIHSIDQPDGRIRYLVLSAPVEARIRVLATRMHPDALEFERLSLRLTRIYPGRESTESADLAPGRATSLVMNVKGQQ